MTGLRRVGGWRVPYEIDPDDPKGWRFVPLLGDEPAAAPVSYAGYTDHPGQRPDSGQEDLTGDDYLAVTTPKVFEADDELPSPPQAPGWRPVSVIDEHGEAVQ